MKPARGRRPAAADMASAELKVTSALAAAVQAKNNKAAQEEKRNGKSVAFSLINVNKAPFKYISPKATVYIPEDFQNDPYLSAIVEKDKDGNYLTGVQEIRYIENVNSIFVKNQPEKVRLNNIVMARVTSLNEYRSRHLINFLRMSSLCKTNPHRYNTSIVPVYEELNVVQTTEDEFDREEALYKIRKFIFENEDDALWAVANVYGIPTRNSKVMRQQLLSYANASPAEFTRLINSQDLPIMERFAVAKELGHIEVAGRKVFWTDDKTIITMLPPEVDWLEYMVEFSKTPAGEEAIAVIDKLFRVN